MMKLLIVILTLFVTQANATTYFLSNTGNDSHDGLTTLTPWQTIAKLNTVIGSLSPGDVVAFKVNNVFDGALAAPANGTPGHRILFTSYGIGAKPIINGFQTLSSWTNLGSNIWEASVNSGLNLNLVLLNGSPVTQGRTPNTGSYYRVATGSVSYPTGFITSSDLNASSINYTGAELVVRSSEYTRDRNFITSASGNQLNFNSQSVHDAEVGTGFFIQHDVRTLDQQNEWFYNSTAHTIRMYSTSNPSTIGTGVKAAVYDMAVTKDYQSYVEFNGLKFQGYDSIAIKYWQPTGTKVINCDFDQIGAEAMVFDTGTRDSVMNNTITNIYNTGIYFIYCTFPVAMYNDINGCGNVIGMSQGNNQQEDGIFCVNTADSAVIKYNSVQNVGYCGITFDGNNTIVRGNYVNNFALDLADGGGIYTCCNYIDNTPSIGLRQVDSNIVVNGYGRHNDWSSIYDGGAIGIYYDDWAGEISSQHNTVINTTRAAIFFHNTSYQTLVDNIVYQANGHQALLMGDDGAGGPLRNTIVTFNHFYVQPSTYAVQLESGLNDYTSMGTFSNNWYSRSATGQLFNIYGAAAADYSLSSWRSTFGWDDQSSLTQVNDDSVRVEFNSTASPKYVLLPNTYADLRGSGYYRYVPIPAYSSLLLYRKTFGTLKTGRPIRVIPQ